MTYKTRSTSTHSSVLSCRIGRASSIPRISMSCVGTRLRDLKTIYIHICMYICGFMNRPRKVIQQHKVQHARANRAFYIRCSSKVAACTFSSPACLVWSMLCYSRQALLDVLFRFCRCDNDHTLLIVPNGLSPSIGR